MFISVGPAELSQFLSRCSATEVPPGKVEGGGGACLLTLLWGITGDGFDILTDFLFDLHLALAMGLGEGVGGGVGR